MDPSKLHDVKNELNYVSKWSKLIPPCKLVDIGVSIYGFGEVSGYLFYEEATELFDASGCHLLFQEGMSAHCPLNVAEVECLKSVLVSLEQSLKLKEVKET